MIDLHDWEERSAILEYNSGMSRFEAETQASIEFGVQRWEVINAIERRNFNQIPNTGEQASRDGQIDLSELQSQPQKQKRQVSISDLQAGRDSLELLALLPQQRGLLR